MSLTTYQGIQGYSRFGKLVFDPTNLYLFNIAVKAFNTVSKFGAAYAQNTQQQVMYNLNYFLLSLQIVSQNEGNFDALNTYDNAGISVGFIQFARPQVQVYNILSNVDKLLAAQGKALTPFNTNVLVGGQPVTDRGGNVVLATSFAEEVRIAFNNIQYNTNLSYTFADNNSKKSRVNNSLLIRVVQAAASPEGVQSQLTLAIQGYYDTAFKLFQTFVFKDDRPIAQQNTIRTYQYALAFLVDVAVNMGPGALNKIDYQPVRFANDVPTEGSFIYYNLQNTIKFSDQRKAQWTAILSKKFTIGTVNS